MLCALCIARIPVETGKEEYVHPFSGRINRHEYERETYDGIRREIAQIGEEDILTVAPLVLADRILGKYELRPIAITDVEVIPHAESEAATIEYKIMPHPNNEKVLAMFANGSPVSYQDPLRNASYRNKDAIIILHAGATKDDLTRIDREVRRRIDMINGTIMPIVNGVAVPFTDRFRPFAEQLITRRRMEVEAKRQRTGQFLEDMRSLGFTLKERPGAVKPVDVTVKEEIRALCAPTPQHPDPTEQTLAPESVDRIVGLIDQAGRGFETAPAAFRGLGEEGLRSVILGYLNAVFASDVAKGEVFVKSGKTDVYFNNPGGGILIAECKFWGSEAAYPMALDQLFGYLTVRQAFGVLVTFVDRKGLTDVVERAREAMRVSPSLRGELVTRSDSHFVSHHAHPDDDRRMVTVHHLFFSLWAAKESRRGPRNQRRDDA